MHSQRRLHYLAIRRKDGTLMPSRGSGFCLRRCVGLQSSMLVLQHQTEEGRRLWIVDCNQRVTYACPLTLLHSSSSQVPAPDGRSKVDDYWDPAKKVQCDHG